MRFLSSSIVLGMALLSVPAAGDRTLLHAGRLIDVEGGRGQLAREVAPLVLQGQGRWHRPAGALVPAAGVPQIAFLSMEMGVHPIAIRVAFVLLHALMGTIPVAAQGPQQRLQGGADDDYVRGDEGTDVVAGGAGSDVVEGGEGNDFLFGGGSYTATGAGGAGPGTVVATGQGWTVSLQDNAYVFTGFAGGASVVGDGSDVVDGGAGDDHAWAGDSPFLSW